MSIRPQIVFNDSYYAEGFEQSVATINRLLRPHNLFLEYNFIEDYESPEGEFAYQVKIDWAEYPPRRVQGSLAFKDFSFPVICFSENVGDMIALFRHEYVGLHSRHGHKITKRQPDPNRPEEVAQYFIGDDLFLESHKDKADKSIWGQTYYLSPKFYNLYEERKET